MRRSELSILPSHQCCVTFRFKENAWKIWSCTTQIICISFTPLKPRPISSGQPRTRRTTSTFWEQSQLVMARACQCWWRLFSCPLVSYLASNLTLCMMTNQLNRKYIVDAFQVLQRSSSPLSPSLRGSCVRTATTMASKCWWVPRSVLTRAHFTSCCITSNQLQPPEHVLIDGLFA